MQVQLDVVPARTLYHIKMIQTICFSLFLTIRRTATLSGCIGFVFFRANSRDNAGGFRADVLIFSYSNLFHREGEVCVYRGARESHAWRSILVPNHAAED